MLGHCVQPSDLLTNKTSSESPAPPAALGCLIVVDEQIRACWLGSHLPEQGGDLPAMVTGMVEHMKHLPPKRIGVAFASGIGVRNVIVEAVGNQGLNVLVLV